MLMSLTVRIVSPLIVTTPLITPAVPDSIWHELNLQPVMLYIDRLRIDCRRRNRRKSEPSRYAALLEQFVIGCE